VVEGSTLVVSDIANSRVLKYASPFATDEAATVAVGQANLTSGTANQGGAVGAKTLDEPIGVTYR
jgi:hypothetical protein